MSGHEAVSLGLLFDLRNPARWHRPWSQVVGGALEVVEEAERLGAGAVWATEHHGFSDGYLSQPLIFLSAAAARTRSVRLGTGVLLASFRHPRHVAEQAALLDQISGGRVEIGIGAGYAPDEFAAFGRDLSRRMTLADEAVARIRDELWGGGLVPPPAQDRLPLWLGYQGPQGARRAGRLGVGLLSPQPRLLEPYREGLAEGGHDPGSARMGGLVPLIVAADPERTAHELAPYHAHQLDTYAEARKAEPRAAGDLPALAAAMVDPASPGLRVMTPEQAVESLRDLCAGAPMRHLYLWASVAGMPDHLVREHIELAFGKVAPALASPGAASEAST